MNRRALTTAAAVFLAASNAYGVAIEVGSASGRMGRQATFDVTLNAMGFLVAGTKNKIEFDPATPIVACERNPAINKESTVFDFEPGGCTVGVDCERVEALVVSIVNTDRIPDGSVLYTCTIDIARDAPEASFALPCTDPESSDRNGNALDTDCVDGDIVVMAGGGGGGGCSLSVAPPHECAWLLLIPALVVLTLRRRVSAQAS